MVWVWVSTHGSFPLGGAWLVLSLIGEAIQGKGVISRRRLQCLGTFVVGLVVAMANPLGPALLLFPLKVQQKQAIFKTIIEWASPNFQVGAGLLALAGLTGAVIILARGRPSWTHAIPAAVFVALGLYASRNLPAAAIVLAPALGESLRRGEPKPSEGKPSVVDRAFVAVIGVIVLASVVSVYRRPGVDVGGYPVAAVTWLQQNGLRDPPHRIAAPDLAGNYLEYRFGTQSRVFIDDRYDMFPTQVSNDSDALFFVRPNALQVLDRYKVDVVLWQAEHSFAVLLTSSGRWHQVYRSEGWAVFVRD